MAAIDRLPRVFRTTAYVAMAVQVAVLALAATVIGVLVLLRVNDLLGEQVVETLRTEARGFVDLARSSGRDAVRAAIQERIRPGSADLYILIDAGEAKIAGNLNRWPPELDGRAAGGLFRYTIESGGREGQMHLAAGLPVALAEGMRLVVARDIEEQRAFAASVRNLVVGGLVVMVVLGIVAGALASRYVLRRIATVTTTAETIMAGDLTRRVPETGAGDEIDELAGRLNAMLERIEHLVAGMREISDNIAHDLKTPLTRLRNRAEAALRDPSGTDAHRNGLQQTIEAADDIIRTFDALLLIARLEAGSQAGTTESFDLAAAITDLVELYEPSADEAGFVIRLVAPTAMPLVANRQLVVQAVANLLDNALKYGAPMGGGPGTIDVAVEAGGSEVRVLVGDRGTGIAPADRDRAMERFVRLDVSRSKPGTGLGLSLVAAVARLHGGRVVLADRAPGLAVTLALPTMPGPQPPTRAA